MKYFKTCKTAEEGKKLYRKLAKEFHPDSPNGSVQKMQELNTEYKLWWSTHKDIHFDTKQCKTYTSEKATQETAQEFIDIITAIINLGGIDIEICGSWLWLTGNTYVNREHLKALGCRWSNGKKKWYWTVDPYVRTKYYLSMDKIRQAYGSEIVDTASFKRVQISTGA